jgi:hypothetical protein
MLELALLTVNTFLLSMFLNTSPAFIIVFPLVRMVVLGVGLKLSLASFYSAREATHLAQVDERGGSPDSYGFISAIKKPAKKSFRVLAGICYKPKRLCAT